MFELFFGERERLGHILQPLKTVTYGDKC